ncbi:MAG: recombinase family protein [Rubrobacteraceae bacterium]
MDNETLGRRLCQSQQEGAEPGPAAAGLAAAGCERIFEESISSREQTRPQLEAALDYCREGDVLVVWKLDRLGRRSRSSSSW